MQDRGTNNKSKWEWLKDFFKANTSLTVIIVAALLIELTTGVIYYSSQDIIKRTIIRVMER